MVWIFVENSVNSMDMFHCFWAALTQYQALFCSPPMPSESRLGMQKDSWPSWPQAHAVPYGAMLSSQSWASLARKAAASDCAFLRRGWQEGISIRAIWISELGVLGHLQPCTWWPGSAFAQLHHQHTDLSTTEPCQVMSKAVCFLSIHT